MSIHILYKKTDIHFIWISVFLKITRNYNLGENYNPDDVLTLELSTHPPAP